MACGGKVHGDAVFCWTFCCPPRMRMGTRSGPARGRGVPERWGCCPQGLCSSHHAWWLQSAELGVVAADWDSPLRLCPPPMCLWQHFYYWNKPPLTLTKHNCNANSTKVLTHFLKYAPNFTTFQTPEVPSSTALPQSSIFIYFICLPVMLGGLFVSHVFILKVYSTFLRTEEEEKQKPFRWQTLISWFPDLCT